ncbi:MAG TPA: polysaccharide deacetylase family protein [Thermoanaerobaculia bacterium]|nr:polysaccharide deacetylase family protein [Thermoanaerobaculia bacterium]
MADDRPPYRPPAFLLGSLGLHAAAALALAAAPRHWRAVASLLFADHVALAAASLWPRGQLVGANLLRLEESAARRHEIALTFDDGPDPEVTPRVLDLLDQAGARATFFCIGRRIEAHPGLAAEIARRGHRVENHTHTHPNLFACYPAPALRREVERAQGAIERAAGRRPRLFRAPAGLRNPLLDRVLHQSGLRLVAWTRRGFDSVENAPAAIAQRLLRGLAAGDILLLHDGSLLRERGGNPVVLEVLPRVLDALAARGLRSVPIEAPGTVEAPG